MLRIYRMQQCSDLNHPAMEDALIEMQSIRHFAEIALISNRTPNETQIMAFQDLLEQQDLRVQILEAMTTHLKVNGMVMKKGTILNATTIVAQSSIMNDNQQQDPEMHKNCQGRQ